MEMHDERRVVTAVFADLVGSTALGERLDPEDLKLVVGDAVARMVAAVEAYGGTVKDLAGDGVLALFGAPVAHEDDVERAIHAALRILDDVGAFGGEVAGAWGAGGLSVRVGVETGPVVTGAVGGGSRVEYGAMGDAVNTAARLQSQADPGTVLVGADARRMASAVFTWGPARELRLKGKEESVTAYAVTGVTGAPARSGAQAPMVGRAAELTRAREAADGVLAGAGGIVYVTGEPGIGKTRLLGELRGLFEAAEPAHGRTRWIEGRCVSYGESLPYYPFRELLRSWLGVGADEPELRVKVALRRHVDRLFGDRAPEIAPYLAGLLELSHEPGAAEQLAELSPEALQFRTFEVVRTLFARLAENGPVAVAIEDVHWADATSLQLIERVAGDTDQAALLVVLTGRPERDHPSWHLKEDLARTLPHRMTEIPLAPLSGDAGRELLHALVGTDALPDQVEDRILGPAEGNPFFLEELVRSLVDSGALVHEGERWRFEADATVEVPPTVEKVILARIDRLSPEAHGTLMAAAALGRTFGLPLLEAVAERGVQASLTELMRLDLVREGRRWPEPEYSFKHALIQETAYRTLVGDERKRLHMRAASWLEERRAGREHEGAGLLAYHCLGSGEEDKAIRYLTIAGDSARMAYALDESIAHYRDLLPLLERRGEDREIALVLFKLALALHQSLRFAEANDTYQRAFGYWSPPEPAHAPAATIRIASSFLPDDPDPRSAIAWPNIQLCMQLFDRLVEQWPERTIVPSLAERWEISDDGLRYVFHLREGLTWSDGAPLTAHDVEFGIKRVLDPAKPGSSVAIYFVLEGGLERYLGQGADPAKVGVSAIDDMTVEFRLVAPAPYFMSLMNRPDGAPQPRHAIEVRGDDWTEGNQVVSGAFKIAERNGSELVLERREGNTPRSGNVATARILQSPLIDAIDRYRQDELDVVTVRYTPRLADLLPQDAPDQLTGPPAWSGYLAFRHDDPVVGDVELRRALAHAVDREAVAQALPSNMVVARGGIVPPALQGHTPDIALRFDPDLARSLADGREGPLSLSCLEDDSSIVEPVLESWREVLGIRTDLVTWSLEELARIPPPGDLAPVYLTGWLPGYADPEYFLRLLFHSKSRTNEGGFASDPFDDLIERARQERSDRGRLDLFHEADRMAVADRVAVIPLVYGRSLAIVKPWVEGWWEFGKTSANLADLTVEPGAVTAGP